MLANISINVIAMSFRALVPSHIVFAPSIVMVLTIWFPALGPMLPLVIRSNFLISFIVMANPLTLASILSHMAQSTAQHCGMLVMACIDDFFLFCAPTIYHNMEI